MKKSPKIIAIFHRPSRGLGDLTVMMFLRDVHILHETLKKLKPGSRRLFIEGTPDYIRSKRDPLDPFSTAIWFAKSKGWEIIPLDKRVHTQLIWKEELTPLEQKYAGRNLRERYWAQLIRAKKIQSKDIIILHPGHVKGFLLESGFSAQNVIWLDRGRSQFGRLLHWSQEKRLSRTAEEKLKQKRLKKRKRQHPHFYK